MWVAPQVDNSRWRTTNGAAQEHNMQNNKQKGWGLNLRNCWNLTWQEDNNNNQKSQEDVNIENTAGELIVDIICCDRKAGSTAGSTQRTEKEVTLNKKQKNIFQSELKQPYSYKLQHRNGTKQETEAIIYKDVTWLVF